MSQTDIKYSLPWLAERFDAETALRIWRNTQAREGNHSTIKVHGNALIETWSVPAKQKATAQQKKK